MSEKELNKEQVQPLLQVKQLSKLYPLSQSLVDRIKKRPQRIVRAVDHVDLTLEHGEIVGLVGESGCGKTTLGKMICRLIEPTSGQIELDSKDLLSLSKEELRQLRPRFQMLFQNPYSTLNPKMTVQSLLEETLQVNSKLPKEEWEKEINAALEKVNLPHKKRSYPSELSGGERRRVGLARLLLLKPSLIIADEPVAGLDASIKAKIVDLMLDIRSEDMSYLFISHDLHVIRYVAHRIMVMFLGTIVEKLPTSVFGGNKHHPYTISLLQAAQQVSLKKSVAEEVDFEDLPSHEEAMAGGCPYMNRCPWVGTKVPHERCSQEKPPLYKVADDHWIACHRYEPVKS